MKEKGTTFFFHHRLPGTWLNNNHAARLMFFSLSIRIHRGLLFVEMRLDSAMWLGAAGLLYKYYVLYIYSVRSRLGMG